MAYGFSVSDLRMCVSRLPPGGAITSRVLRGEAEPYPQLAQLVAAHPLQEDPAEEDTV